jgi:DNA mismatch repair protein MutS2
MAEDDKPNTTWKPGSLVWVKKVNKEGQVLDLVRDGTYRVQVGAFTLECTFAELKPIPKGKNKKAPVPRKAKPDYRNPDMRKKMTIDLHGQIVDDAIRNLDAAMSRALFEGYGSMEIIHGLGTGKVRKAVHAHLVKLGVAAHFRLDEKNPGVTWVYFST